VPLNCGGKEDPHEHVRDVTRTLLPLLGDASQLLVVQGDTSSAVGGALAGFMADVPVAHVEAGLRTHDPLLPWPEEEYRVAIDSQADLLFAPTEIAAANLRAERVPGIIHVTGNTGIDATLDAASRLPPPELRDRGTSRILVTCHRRESWEDGLGSIAAALTELAGRGTTQVDFVLHPNPYVATRMRHLLSSVKGIILLEPCCHADLLLRMREADLVLSDSGGIQEEAPTLGVPLLILREKTERPEGIASGSSLLVGTDRNRIVAEVQCLLDNPGKLAGMNRRTFPFGDGKAAPRIAAILADWLEERSLTRRLA
jgi:UDP-N-acetylglucosamine 2-epimerase (non-hydrolysing)